MNKEINQKLGKCKATYTGEHEWIHKWSLSDRNCYKCKKCRREEIIFNNK